jgi:hypothetical protein
MRNLPSQSVSPTVTIRVSGRLSEGHLSYLDQLVSRRSTVSYGLCSIWLALEELDHVALMYLIGGEGRHFGIVGCPNFIREWMQHEKDRCAA